MKRTTSISTRIEALALVLLGLILPALVFAEPPPKLRFDPFRSREEAVIRSAPPERREAVRIFRPILQSTIVGETRSLARLGGVLLAVGEETSGYRLLEVRPFEATFEHDGERLRLEVVQGEGADR